MNLKDQIIEKINNKSAIVGVVGLGYVGLPFAVEKAKMGFKVIGIEQNIERAQKINNGCNYIQDVNDDELKQLVNDGYISAYTDFNVVKDMDVIVICVPTPLTRNLTPDLRYVETVTKEIVKYIRPGQLITLESTTYPGTTEEVMLPILEASGLIVEEDFFLAHSPERVDPGNRRYTTKNTNKVVGGVGSKSLDVAVAFYSQTIDHVVPVSCAKAAELSKVFENTFRAVNIALVNELALLCDRMDLNVWEVLGASFTKPFGIMPFYPGPGVGGHCIAIDPHYLEWKAKEVNFNTHFIALAGEINRKMPEFVRDKAVRILNQRGVPSSQANIVVLGVAYKRDIDDYRESPAIEVINLLQKTGANVVYCDSYIPTFLEFGLKMSSTPLTKELLNNSDLVIIATDHSDIDYEWVIENSPHVFDTRNATSKIASSRDKITLL